MTRWAFAINYFGIKIYSRDGAPFFAKLPDPEELFPSRTLATARSSLLPVRAPHARRSAFFNLLLLLLFFSAGPIPRPSTSPTAFAEDARDPRRIIPLLESFVMERRDGDIRIRYV